MAGEEEEVRERRKTFLFESGDPPPSPLQSRTRAKTENKTYGGGAKYC